jgi:hypothetical protein
MVLDTVRRLLQLPPATPSALLHAELRLLPAHLLAHERSLREVGRLVQHEWWFDQLVRPLLDSTPTSSTSAACDIFMSVGPLARWERLLLEYQHYLFPRHTTTLASRPRQVWTLLQRASRDSGAWKTAVSTAISQAFQAWLTTKLSQYPQDLRQHLKTVLCTVDTRLPDYLRRTSFLGPVGLRWKLPALGIYDRTTGCRACILCGQAKSEVATHLLHCGALQLPANLAESLSALRTSIQREARCPPGRVDTQLLHLTWRKQTPTTLRQALGVLRDLMNVYRSQAAVLDPSSTSRIWAIRTIACQVEAQDDSSSDGSTSQNESLDS